MTTSLLSKQVSAMEWCALQELLYWRPWSHLFRFVIHAYVLNILSDILVTTLKQKRLLTKRFSKNSVFTCLWKHVQSPIVCLSVLLDLLVSVVFFFLWTIPCILIDFVMSNPYCNLGLNMTFGILTKISTVSVL